MFPVPDLHHLWCPIKIPQNSKTPTQLWWRSKGKSFRVRAKLIQMPTVQCPVPSCDCNRRPWPCGDCRTPDCMSNNDISKQWNTSSYTMMVSRDQTPYTKSRQIRYKFTTHGLELYIEGENQKAGNYNSEFPNTVGSIYRNISQSRAIKYDKLFLCTIPWCRETLYNINSLNQLPELFQ